MGLIAGRWEMRALGRDAKMPKPICFMIMPYGKKATQAEPSVGVAEIDFNALWDRAYAPVIEDARLRARPRRPGHRMR